MTEASAPAKLILCGEHAVVYGRPAIALPLGGIRARVTIDLAPAGSGITFDAPDMDRRWSLAAAPDEPLSALAVRVCRELGVAPPDVRVTISSPIPIAGGMGSGAAVATALVRALAAHLGYELAPETVSALVYESERRLHGTPSGIDNTVIAFERPIWFVRQPPTDSDRRPGTENEAPRRTDTQHAIRRMPQATIEPIAIATPLTLLIGDTGVRSATRLPVGAVRQRWQADPARYEALFDQIGVLVWRARAALAQGEVVQLGALLDQNHALLQQIGVSSPELDRLVEAARAAGALGAKLSGAGWGGVMVALVAPQTREHVRATLAAAGATQVLETTIDPS